jgi:hypothetical protein
VVAQPSASSGPTWCGGTGGGSSSVIGGKHRARWYWRGHTEAVVRRRGGGGSAGQRHSGVGSELRWPTKAVVGAWSTGKRRGSEERRQFGLKNLERRTSS